VFFGFCGIFFLDLFVLGLGFFFGSSIVIGIYIGLDIFGFWYFFFGIDIYFLNLVQGGKFRY